MDIAKATNDRFAALYSAGPQCLDEKLAAAHLREAEVSLVRSQVAFAESEQESGNSAVRSGSLLGGLAPVPAAIREQVISAARYFDGSVEELSQATLNCSSRKLSSSQERQLATEATRLKTPLNDLRSAPDEALGSQAQAFSQTAQESSSSVLYRQEWLFGSGE